MRIIFAGTPANAATTLEALLASGHEVVGVLTRMDAPTGRSGTITESPVAAVAEHLGIELHKTNVLNQHSIDWMASLAPDLGVIVAFGSILRSDVLSIPRRGWINLHYSALPKYPGASPVQQAVIDGAPRTGVTVFELDEGIDSGPVLAQSECQISPQDTAGSLLERLTAVGSDLLLATLRNFDELSRQKSPQVVGGSQIVTKKITRQQARIDFGFTAEAIVNLVRGMNPEPVAWFEHDSQPVRVLEATRTDVDKLPTGTAQLIGKILVVGCSDSSVVLSVVQPAGKQPMSGADWFRGLRKDSVLLT